MLQSAGMRGLFRMDGVAQFLQELIARERLLQEEASVQGAGRDVEFFRVARDEDDDDVREFLLDAAGKFGAAHAGHDDVRQQNVDGAAEALGDFEGFDAVGGRKNLVTGGVEEFAGEGANGGFVFDEQNRLAVTALGGDRFRGLHDGQFFLRVWQVDFEASAGAGRRLDMDAAGTLIDDAINGGEAKTGAFAGFLGGEEGFKDAGFDFGGHAGTVIGDGKHGVVAGLEGRMRERVLFIGDDIVGFNDEFSAAGHGVGGVDGEIEKDLFDLTGVGEDAAERIAAAHVEFDVFAKKSLEEAAGFHDEVVEIEDAGLKQLPAAESKQLAGERGGAVGDFADLLAIGPGGIGGLDLIEGEVAVALDDGEEIVEIVRDAAGETAEGVHFLRLAKLVFELFALGFIALKSAAHAGKGACERAQFVATDGGEWECKVALFERANAVHQRAERFGKGAGDEIGKEAAGEDGGEAEYDQKEIETADGSKGGVARLEDEQVQVVGSVWRKLNGADKKAPVVQSELRGFGLRKADGGKLLFFEGRKGAGEDAIALAKDEVA